MTATDKSEPRRVRRLRRRLTRIFSAILVIYLGVAYLILPEVWRIGEERFGLPDAMRTETWQHIPGDPINLVFVGTRQEIIRAFDTIGWHPADPVSFRSAVEIGLSVVFDRSYAGAPVSTLLFEGRAQDLSFELAVGTSADRRHHIRLWSMTRDTIDGRKVFAASASLDRGIGISHDTGAITHHIGPDIDAERDAIAASFADAGLVAKTYSIAGSGPTWEGRNGEGDLYVTDGNATVVVLTPAIAPP